MKKLLITTVLFLMSTTAQANERIETALHFLKALEASDMATVEQLVHDDITFQDLTWDGTLHAGRENVLKVYRGYTGGAHNILGHVLNAFESNHTVVLDYVIYAQMDVARDTKPEDRVPMIGRAVRVIGFKDGKIVRHMDMADYDKVKAAMAAAQAQ